MKKSKTKGTKFNEWQNRCSSGNEKCAKCGETRNLTVDHIVPAMFIEQICMDTDTWDAKWNLDENYEILCRYCNNFKSNRIDPRNPRTIQVLQMLIDRLKK